MVIDKTTIEAVTIYAHKLGRDSLVWELLNFLRDMNPNEYFHLPQKPDLKLVVDNKEGSEIQ